jgi:hypothetical protein
LLHEYAKNKFKGLLSGEELLDLCLIHSQPLSIEVKDFAYYGLIL